MAESTLTSKGQITIPKRVREALGLETGDRMSFRVREDGVVEMVPETLDVMSLFGILKPRKRGVSLEDMEEAISREAFGK
jgi:AbrB family looped-hinge helix DNA binding protein